MRCIKTGFYAEMNGRYFYGDAFASEARRYGDEPHDGVDTLLLRVCAASREQPTRCHIQLNTYDLWFEERDGKEVAPGAYVWQPNSTLIASPGQWCWLGYDGVQL